MADKITLKILLYFEFRISADLPAFRKTEGQSLVMKVIKPETLDQDLECKTILGVYLQHDRPQEYMKTCFSP